MPARSPVDEALIVSGDARIQGLLDRDETVVVPAYACRLDGFVNDTFTEYADASVYRPASVCRARLVSTLQDTTRISGRYHMGFTMYTVAGQEETIEVWIGHRQVALARIDDPDNRVHLFVAPRAFTFRSGEPIRLVTPATTGPCRIENIVYLPRKPKPTPVGLQIVSPHVDVQHAEKGMRAAVTWLTNRPASGELKWGVGTRLTKTVRLGEELVNHEAVLEGLPEGKSFRYEIRALNGKTRSEASVSGTFRTSLKAPRTRAGAARVPIRLRRGAGGPWPVSVGVPFPEGALGDPAEVRLLSRGGRERPVQVSSMARWPDGSVQWAQLDFSAEGKGDYRAEFGRGVVREVAPDRLTAKEGRSGITVTTGPIQVTFDKDRVCFPGNVSVRQEDGSYRPVTSGRATAVTLVDATGAVYKSAKPDSVVLEASGPERACVRVDFRHHKGSASCFRSRMRVHLFRGSGLVRVLHTFVNDRTDEEFTELKSLSLRAGLKLDGDVAGRLNGRQVVPTGEKPAAIVQTHDNRFALKLGNRTATKGRRANGIVELKGNAGRVGFCLRDFWQNYPKGLSVDPSGITVDICPEVRKSDYPRGGELEDRIYYHLLNGTHRLKAGVSRTHEMWFDFAADGTAGTEGFPEAAQNPPLYSVSLDAFNKSRAITRLPEKARSPFPPYEAWVDAAQQAYGKDREESRAYGMLNFGDWFGERTYNWGNMEYDAPWCFLQEYLRGGDSQFFTWAEEAVRHLVDVDTCHVTRGSDEAGAQYLHSVGHVGGYYPDGYRERAIFTGRSSVSHTWVEGPFLYALITGDPQVLEAATQTSDLLVGRMLNHYDFTNCRNSGWHLIHLSAAYRATGRRVYLNAARVIVDRVLERQRPSGGWDRLMVPGHCHCNPPRHTGNAGFMVGILMVGLKRFYEATGEKRVADAIVAAADYCIDTMWVPERRAFRYTCCPHSSVGWSADMRILKGVATAYQFSRKPRFREVLVAGVRSAMDRGGPSAHRGVGKSICSPMRGAPQVLVDLPKGIEASRAEAQRRGGNPQPRPKAASRKSAKNAR